MDVAELINELAGLPPMMEVMVGTDTYEWLFPTEVVIDTGLASPTAVILTSDRLVTHPGPLPSVHVGDRAPE